MPKIFHYAIYALLIFPPLAGWGQQGFPYCESFQGEVERDQTIFGGDARLLDGVLRLTDAVTDQNGYVYINIPFASGFGVKASFEYFSYGGDGADGLSVFLFDGAHNFFAPGGFGGSLGYAPKEGSPGLSGAYMGIGFDSFGNFGNVSEGKTGGFPGSSNAVHPNSIVVRGPGQGSTGYQYVAGVKTNEGGNFGLPEDQRFTISSGGRGTRRITSPEQPGYRKVIVKLQPRESGVGFLLNVEMIFTAVAGNPRQISLLENVDYPYPAPETLKIGFAASTGSVTNIHEIRNLLVEVADEDNLQKPETAPLDDMVVCLGQENLLELPAGAIDLPNVNSRISCMSFFETQEEITEQADDPCLQGDCESGALLLQEGEFRYLGQGGQFSFTPNEGFQGDEVQVFYTVTDNYGMTSSGGRIRLLVNQAPEPISIFINELPLTALDACPGADVELSLFPSDGLTDIEWTQDGQVLPGESVTQITVSAPGIYRVRAKSIAGCPLVSDPVEIIFPDFPDLEISETIFVCQPDLFPDIRTYITDFNGESFDYQVEDENGDTFENEMITEINLEGAYLLRVKPKEIACWSDPVTFRLSVPDDPLVASFDYVLNATGLKEEAPEGILADDRIRFLDQSTGLPRSWHWDFGDGNTSNQRSPAHVFGEKGEFLVTLTVQTGPDCTSSYQMPITITRTYRVMFPSGFTPSREEDNLFGPKTKGIAEMDLKIFSIWGELLFQTTDLNGDGWDGTLNGSDLPPGTYVYRADFETTRGEPVTRSGKFLLIR
ncbi:gliding motility-associated C-terminal domain-containing protein [Cyclobacterium lianum]|uniref:Gliding motility-associated C-terminal domain-containing protein n=1 Tax=Cyclobacterium lianum TaxID=388280 RepID=A0A1M7QRW3_9BACT|nr:PKD domain-containing protein [Cyclobacterium lianum]SHN34390.1 gliding motility-associated C-terminal domain-containing protein [Cyclobacterium lianum]